MVWVDPKIASKVAHTPEIKAAVRAERDRVADIARGVFASHDRPGGHEITTQNDRTDALLSIDGPAPLSMEFGHWSETKNGRKFVEGLHILQRAIAQASE